MKRPVKCLFCKRQMFYFGDLKFKPEICLTFAFQDLEIEQPKTYYIHRKCWERIKEIKLK